MLWWQQKDIKMIQNDEKEIRASGMLGLVFGQVQV